MTSESQQPRSKTPVLKLRPSVTTEQIVPRLKVKQPYGPWIAHPGLIDEEFERRRHLVHFPPDVTRDEHRRRWKDEIPVLEAEIEDCKLEDFDLRAVISMAPKYDMQYTLCQSDHEQAKYLERYYVGAHMYDNLHFE